VTQAARPRECFIQMSETVVSLAGTVQYHVTMVDPLCSRATCLGYTVVGFLVSVSPYKYTVVHNERKVADQIILD